MFSKSSVAAMASVLMAVAAAPAQAQQPAPSPLTLDLGDGVAVKLYGYIKADAIWDRDFDLGDTTSGLRDIGLPTGPTPGKSNRQHLRETRIGLDVTGRDVFARFEGDFFGPDASLRLRHAYVEWAGAMVGQNWTNFMSVENLAASVDFQGATAVPFARVPQLRYTFQTGSDVKISASVEEDVGNSGDRAFTLAARYGFDLGMVRASAMTRDAQLSGNQVNGWGINLATVLDLWQGGTVKVNVLTGDGIADILAAGLSGTAVYTGGSEVGVNAAAFTVTQQINDKLLLALNGNWLALDRAAAADTKELRTLHLSAFFTAFRNTTFMAEYYTGTRTQGNGVSFDNDRIQLAVKYAF